MPYLIDGHNLIPKVAGLSLEAADDELQLIQRLQAYCLRKGKQAEVYFDRAAPGHAGTRRYGPVRAHFVLPDSSADAAIGKRLARLGRRAANWTVVTSDRQVQAEARAAHAQVVSAEEFALLLDAIPDEREKSGDPGPTMSPSEVEGWLQIFESGDEPSGKA